MDRGQSGRGTINVIRHIMTRGPISQPALGQGQIQLLEYYDFKGQDQAPS